MSVERPGRACLSCTSRAINGTKYCAKHTDTIKEMRKMYDRYRADDPIRKLYHCLRWKRVRQVVLNRDVLCRDCGHRAATECDHILAARLVLDHFGLDEFYNPERLQGLCHGCHSSKTGHEYGYGGGKGTRLTNLGDRSNTTVVCGLPGSGKTTYVATHMLPTDVVWDYDVVMASITGLPLHVALDGAVGSVLANRDQFLAATERSSTPAWVIVSNPNAQLVKLLDAAGAKVVVLEISDEERERRLHQRRVTEALM